MTDEGVFPWFFRNPVSAGTHLLWCVFGLAMTALLWRLARGDRIRQICVAVFGTCATILYGVSGAYHSLRIDAGFMRVDEGLVEWFRLLDHSAIYLLIAGTYTPVFGVLLVGRLRVAMLCVVWGLAAVGIACKWLIAMPPYGVTVGIYIAFGWIGMVPVYHLIKAVGVRAMAIGLLGGLLYTAGGICDAVHWPVLIPGVIGYHEVLHMLDMGGTLTHAFFMVRYVLPYPVTSPFPGGPAVLNAIPRSHSL